MRKSVLFIVLLSIFAMPQYCMAQKNVSPKSKKGVEAQRADSLHDAAAAHELAASDSIALKAQNLAYKNHFSQAEAIIAPLAAKYPKNYAYSVFYGQVLSWEHKYDSSKAILKGVILNDPKNLEAYDALTNAELWSRDDSMTIVDCNNALAIPKADKESFGLKIAEANLDLKKIPPAYAIVDSFLAKNATDTSALSLKKEIYAAQMQKTADSLFDTANHLTYRRKYDSAIRITGKLSLQYPTNTDYKILWARLLAFKHKVDTSKILLYEVLKADPKNLEAYDAVADDELISGKFRRSDSLCDTALRMHVKGDKTSIVITKASAQDNMMEYYEAESTIDTLVVRLPGDSDAVNMLKLIKIHILQKKADSLFLIAVKESEAKSYKQALDIIDTISKWFPNNTEYTLFEGRVFSWMGKYDTAIVIISKVIKKEPHNMDAYDALTDAEIWKKDYKKTITDCDKALADSIFRGYPSMVKQDTSAKALHARDSAKLAAKKDTAKPFVNKDTNAKKYWSIFMLKRAHAQYNMEDYKGTVATLDTMMKKDSTNQEANDLLTEAKIKLLKNVIQVGYLNNSFAPPTFGPWHYIWLQYTRNFDHCPVSAKVTYGSIYGLPVGWRQGLQYELGAYPKFSAGTFADASVAFSPTFAVFPEWQVAANLYQKLPLGFEGSIGGIYMHFIDVVDEPPTPPQDIWIFDPYIGYYWGSHWQFSYRPYIAYKATDHFYLTHSAVIRHFFKNPDNWVSLYGTIGTSPFVDYYFPSPTPTGVKLVGIDYQTRLPHNWLIWPMLSYEYLEYYPPNNLWTNMYYVQIIVTKRF